MPKVRIPRAGRPALSLAVAAIAIAVMLLGCAGSSASILSTVGAPIGEQPGYPDVAQGALAAPSAAPAASSDDSSIPGTESGGGDAVGAVDDARIVRTGTMELEVKDVPAAVDAARTAIRGMGGYVGASQTSNDGDQPVAVITYRIPVDRWEDALAMLRSLNGQTQKVVTEQTEAVEVTGQIVDLTARIKNLRASEAALQEIASRAVKVSDVLEVENQLTDVRGQIEVLTGELAQLSNRADLATLAVTFRLPVVAVQVAQQGWDPAAQVDQATASLVEILQQVATAGIWFAIVWLPVLAVVLIVGGLLAWIVRRSGIGRRLSPPPTPPATGATPTGTHWGS